MVSIVKNNCGKSLVFFLYGLFAMFLAACGGGGGSPGSTEFGGGIGGSGGTAGGTSGAAAITVELTDSAGAASNSVTGSNSLIVKAKVTAGGVPAKDVLVTFTLGGALAALSPASGTALTDANGIAQVSLKSANIGSGADEVTATATVSATEVTAKKAFSVGAAPAATPAAINFVSAVPADKSIVIKGSGGNGRTEVALLTFSVVDSANSGVTNVAVSFAQQSNPPINSSSTPVTLVSSSGTTDANGNVTVAVNSGTEPTTVRVIATVAGTSISAISDTVTVTTGQPTGSAFSLAAEKLYVEGLNFDNTPNKLTVLLADQFGGAVADGTQVVFTTDGGAIVGTGGARCLTVNGECNVTWRSQNPRTESGVVAVTATATNAAGPLSATIKFYSSGSFGTVKVLSPANVQAVAGGPINYDFGTSCTPVTFSIEVIDSKNNPMPVGTTVSVANASKGSATVSPATVAFDGSAIVGNTGGTLHDVTVTPASCSGAAIDPQQTGLLDVNLKSPLGSVASTRLNFTFHAP